jgi:hypothetical protein
MQLLLSFVTQAQPWDHLQRIPWRAGVKDLPGFLLDNVDYIKDLDASLAGKKILLCNPDPGVHF